MVVDSVSPVRPALFMESGFFEYFQRGNMPAGGTEREK